MKNIPTCIKKIEKPLFNLHGLYFVVNSGLKLHNLSYCWGNKIREVLKRCEGEFRGISSDVVLVMSLLPPSLLDGGSLSLFHVLRILQAIIFSLWFSHHLFPPLFDTKMILTGKYKPVSSELFKQDRKETLPGFPLFPHLDLECSTYWYEFSNSCLFGSVVCTFQILAKGCPLMRKWLSLSFVISQPWSLVCSQAPLLRIQHKGLWYCRAHPWLMFSRHFVSGWQFFRKW